MGKKQLYLLWCCFFAWMHNAAAQKNFTLTYKYVFASNDTMSVVWGDKIKLLVQDSISFTGNQTVLDSLNFTAEKPVGSTHFAKVTYCIANKGIRINPLGRISHPREWKLGVQEIDKGKWLIGKEQKRIAGFECTLATGVIYNRSCTVWFNTAFPGGYGPHILTSLPGSIFEIRYDDTGAGFTVVETAETVLPLQEPVYCKRVKLR